ncbi:hypothetical protein [Pontivivens ytuae]|uniref:Uncharacterized protein n=1 Tax=Pontivivens ytuae TaxID=2789856 RepID=A0A7S9LV75_9RHOB|nr:hypothetical protein [Pontivivens ytuae]QPH55335.1 hypothetical protein I0K15_06240 [Pontivivens ytuae]
MFEDDANGSLIARIPSAAQIIAAYIVMAGVLVSARAGINVSAALAGTVPPTTGVAALIDLLIDSLGVDALVSYFYGWLIESQRSLPAAYIEIGYFIFAPVAPAAGAIWFRTLVDRLGPHRRPGPVALRIVEFAGMVLWCFLFGWVIALLVWFWPLFAYYFIFRMTTFDEGSVLMRRQSLKGVAIVVLGFPSV